MLAGRDRIVAAYAGEDVLVVSHVTPIKTLVADALGAPLEAVSGWSSHPPRSR